jgi:hypothetical protein
MHSWTAMWNGELGETINLRCLQSIQLFERTYERNGTERCDKAREYSTFITYPLCYMEMKTGQLKEDA